MANKRLNELALLYLLRDGMSADEILDELERVPHHLGFLL